MLFQPRAPSKGPSQHPARGVTASKDRERENSTERQKHSDCTSVVGPLLNHLGYEEKGMDIKERMEDNESQLEMRATKLEIHTRRDHL